MKRFLTIIALFAVCVTVMAQTQRVKGDVDGDGSVTSADVTLLYNYLLNNDTGGIQNGDIDGDGYITSSDVTFVYNILLGIEPAEEEHEYVDMGLPSGTLWATTNVGADKPEDYGDYFAWGETTPKDVYDWSTYQWCNGTYNTLTKYCANSSHGYNGFVDYMTELDPEDDAATANWGAEWCMPSKEQINELQANCTWEWTQRNNVDGYLVTSNLNGATLFFPAAGYYKNSPTAVGTRGHYWSRTHYGTTSYLAYILYFTPSNVVCSTDGRNFGRSVRPVRVQEKGHEYVDMGLPSGTLWSKTNVGADRPEDYGDYFAWGETEPKSNYSWSTYQWCNGSYGKMTKYCTDSSYGNNGFTDNKTELDAEDDAATANWGEEWCMPSNDQVLELMNNCTTMWITRNGVYGQLFTSNINGATLFFPAAGYRDGGSLDNVGASGSCWSRSLDVWIPDYAYYLSFGSSEVITFSHNRSRGRSVRPVRVLPKHKYVNLGLPSGTLWATMNVGAQSPEDYGHYFAWGETYPKVSYKEDNYQWYESIEFASYYLYMLTKYCTDSNYGYEGFVDNITVLDAEDDAATDIWGPEWRMPSNDQMQELIDNCTSQWTTKNGVNGMLFTSNINGASLFLPAAGYCWYAGHYDTGSYGGYWSRTLSIEYTHSANYLVFDSGSVYCSDYSRYYGHCVRAVYVPQN